MHKVTKLYYELDWAERLILYPSYLFIKLVPEGYGEIVLLLTYGLVILWIFFILIIGITILSLIVLTMIEVFTFITFGLVLGLSGNLLTVLYICACIVLCGLCPCSIIMSYFVITTFWWLTITEGK